MMIEQVRAVVAEFSGVPAEKLTDDVDLYRAGMTSHASVQVMLGLEEAFDIEFSEDMLNPETFASIRAIAAALLKLGAKTEA